MATVSFQEFMKKAGGLPEDIKVVSSAAPKTPSVSPEKSLGQKGKELAVGFGKGVGSSLQGLQELGQLGMSVLPGVTREEIKNTTGIKSLAEADFGAKTGYEKAGKTIEFIAEILFPVGGAAKASGASAKATEMVGASLDNISSKVAGISDDVVEGGVKVKDKIIDVVAGLDDKTKTALKRTPKELFDTIVQKGKDAMLDDRNQTPLEFVGESVANGLKKVKEIASEVGQRKSELIKLPEAFVGKGMKAFGDGLQSFLNSRNLIDNDKTIVKQIVAQFKKLGATPSKGQVDKFIDFAQEALYAGDKNLTVPLTNKTVGGLKKLISGLNSSLKQQLPEAYGKLNDEYGRLIELVGELNTKLGRESGNAGSLIKRLFSPSDARTKELFEELGKITGGDYFRDARLAKFVMDVLGDTRAASILQQIPTSSRGLIEKVVEKGFDLVRDPLKSAEKFIENQK